MAPKCTSRVRLDGKTAVVTGCNTGIGKPTVKDLCRRGCRVIMACRDVKKGEEAKNDILKELEKEDKIGVLVVKELDLSSLKSVRKCAEEILNEERRIDILINNAGVFAPPQGVTEDGFEIQLATNHLGHFLFTLLLLPKIIRSAPSRIVNVSSDGHSMWKDTNFEDINYETHKYTPYIAYGRSKLANILFTKELARKLEGKGVHVYAVHPGAVKTSGDRHWREQHPYLSKITNKIQDWFFRTPEEGAQTTIYCAVDEKAANESGLYYSDNKPKTPSREAQDPELAKKLWDLSVDWVKIGEYDPFDEKNLVTMD